ncbi:MAG: thiamine pyrophosphate-dependent enzyme [Candidatus Pacearchaeota archaeon]
MENEKTVCESIESSYKKTWCPGCPNYMLFRSYVDALNDLIKEKKLSREKIVQVCGIGCHGKVHDYTNITSINALHGRVLPVIFGIKAMKPEVKVIGISGDGDSYNEGISHLIHAARYNLDATFIVHNNQSFSLTVGQHTATTQQGFLSKSLRNAVKDEPLNPLKLMLSLDTSFVARCYALEIEHTKNIMKEAFMHKGFSFIEVLQPCIVFNDSREYISKRIYKLNRHNISSFEQAWKKACEWDYNFSEEAKIPIGIFYKKVKPTFAEKYNLEINKE